MNARSEKGNEVDLSALQEELAQLREDVARIAGTLAELGRKGVEEVKSAGADRVEELRRELEQVSREVQRRGRDAVAGVEETVRERPFTSVLLAFGLGLILSRLLLDRR